MIFVGKLGHDSRREQDTDEKKENMEQQRYEY